jgi:hypothetical protein
MENEDQLEKAIDEELQKVKGYFVSREATASVVYELGAIEYFVPIRISLQEVGGTNASKEVESILWLDVDLKRFFISIIPEYSSKTHSAKKSTVSTNRLS